jgi:hypothetical protein
MNRLARVLLRFLPAAVCFVLCVAVFRTASADAIQTMRWRWAIGVAAWWSGTLVAAACVPFRLGTMLGGGAAYVLAAGLGLRAVYANDHSTAAIGLLVLPLYLSMGLAVVVSGIETALALVRSVRARRPAGSVLH